MKRISTCRAATFAIAIALVVGFSLFHPHLAYSQTSRTFVVLYRSAPPPDDPNEWVIVVPSDSNFTALYAAGFQPAPPSGPGVFFNYTQAATAADSLVNGMFSRVCHRAFSVFFHGITGEQRVVEDFAEKPYGFHLRRGGLCKFEALAMIGTPMSYTLLATGVAVPFTATGFPAPPPGKTPPVLVPPVKAPPKKTPPVVSEVQLAVEEIPVKPPSGGGGQPPVVEEIPESGGGGTPPVTPPRTPTQPAQAQVVTAPPQAPLQPGPQTPPPTQPQPSTPGDVVGDELRYGPFSVSPGQWQSTGIHLTNGQAFRVEAGGTWKYTEGTKAEFGPDGGGAWGWWGLKGKIGEQLIGLGSRGNGTAKVDGALELGAPATNKMGHGEEKVLTGAYTVYVFIKR